LERLLDSHHHAVEVGVDVRVPEPQCAETSAPEDRITHGVVVGLRIIGVLAPVDLDDKPMLETDKVQVEAEQWRLSAKMEALDAHQS